MNTTEDNSTNQTWKPSACYKTITENKVHWYQSMLIPAIGCICLFAWLHRRRNIAPKFCDGRPGLPRPLNFLDDKINRVHFVVAFCVTAWMLQEITVGQMQFGIESDKFSQYWVHLLAGGLIAIICYPISAGASSDHTIGFAVGTVFVWILTVSYVVFNFPCDLTSDTVDYYATADGILKIVEFLPCLVALCYLSFVYPRRLVARFRGQKAVSDTKEEQPNLSYVRELLSKRKLPEAEAPKSKWQRCRQKMTYTRIKGFRYSISILSAVFVSMLLVFTTWITLIQISVMAKGFISGSPYVLYKFDYGYLNMIKSLLVKLFRMFGTTKLAPLIPVVFYFCLTVGLILMVVNLFSSLVAHRKNLLNSYKGKFVDSLYYQRSPRGIVVSLIKYIGFQFAFAIWGLLITTVIFAAMLGGTGGLLYFWLISKMELMKVIRPFINSSFGFCVNSVIFNVIQHLIIHFFFLQRDEHGKRLLAIDNHSLFVNFHYFMLLPNVALGLFVSGLRLLLAIVLSMWTLPRLDKTAYSRHFEFLDTAYTAYVGLLKMESSQTNPSLLTFVHLIAKPEERDRKATSKSDQLKKRIKNKWHLFYTLLRNPQLQLLRKHPGPATDSVSSDISEHSSSSYSG